MRKLREVGGLMREVVGSDDSQPIDVYFYTVRGPQRDIPIRE